ncbi:hypothetical protein AK830_g3550 [Neonectria ditissima]|uniref:Uncharacterized protein n=1 Tax=Neonectria ditissima TaxID=78410 RepID=A0A0P7BBL0_9HYPO|nr:hypothetical protein AK830_g3550 [Neonectria ditissima]
MASNTSAVDDTPLSPALTVSSAGIMNSVDHDQAVDWDSRPTTPDHVSVSSTAGSSPDAATALEASEKMNRFADKLVGYFRDMANATDSSAYAVAWTGIVRCLPGRFAPDIVQNLAIEWTRKRYGNPATQQTAAPLPTRETTEGPRRGCPICGGRSHATRRCWFLALPGTVPGSMTMPNMTPERLEYFSNVNHPALPQGIVLVAAAAGQPRQRRGGPSRAQ